MQNVSDYYSTRAFSGEDEPGYEDVFDRGQREDEGVGIKYETTVNTDVDDDVPEFPDDGSGNIAELVEEPEVKPETETLPVYTQGHQDQV